MITLTRNAISRSKTPFLGHFSVSRSNFVEKKEFPITRNTFPWSPIHLQSSPNIPSIILRSCSDPPSIDIFAILTRFRRFWPKNDVFSRGRDLIPILGRTEAIFEEKMSFFPSGRDLIPIRGHTEAIPSGGHLLFQSFSNPSPILLQEIRWLIRMSNDPFLGLAGVAKRFESITPFVRTLRGINRTL